MSGRHQFFFRSLSNLHYPHELIHDAVCLPLCRTLQLKSDDWMLHVRVGKTHVYAIDSMYITITPRCNYSHCRVRCSAELSAIATRYKLLVMVIILSLCYYSYCFWSQHSSAMN